MPHQLNPLCMETSAQVQIDAFFTSIKSWRAAYAHAYLHFMGMRTPRGLTLVSARIFMEAWEKNLTTTRVQAHEIEAGVWKIDQKNASIETIVEALVTDRGFDVPGVGILRLPSDERNGLYVAPPVLLHPEGINAGNRLAVLTIQGSDAGLLLHQPDTDWRLKAAEHPYESLQELCSDFGLGMHGRTTIEVVARPVVEVLGKSRIQGTSAELGLWLSKSLETAQTRLGYRILDNGRVVERGSIPGSNFVWTDEDHALIGRASIKVPAGSIVQCIASIAGHAHHVYWHADPAFFQNPRLAVFSVADPNREILRRFLQPDQLKSKAASDFEAAIAWMLWTLGFATATFGNNSKVSDYFDTIAVSPNGNFLVVECTLGLLKADSKLSRLSNRASLVRNALDSSNMKHVRVVPVMVTAMPKEQIKVDLPSAEENGILVITKEDLIAALDADIHRPPNAEHLFTRAAAAVEDRRIARTATRSPATQ